MEFDMLHHFMYNIYFLMH
uniref:Uncharacterized protein n=1 Tax=Rhizophora mucronata TaxID=61149 RepID=A0A2P2QD70_RHIMU